MEETEKKADILEKDINQLEKVEPVTKALSSMGIFWKKITTKLVGDSICYICKKKLEKKEEFNIIEIPHKKLDNGMVGFVSVCKDCSKD